MLVAQEISVYLNNTLKPTRVPAELDSEGPLPATVRDMPEEVSGRFIGLDTSWVHDIEGAWKRVMILNNTEVLYNFNFEPQTLKFTARKR